MSRLLCLEAKFLLKEEKYDNALENYFSALRLAHQIRDQKQITTILEEVVNIILQLYVYYALEETLKKEDLDSPILRGINKFFEDYENDKYYGALAAFLSEKEISTTGTIKLLRDGILSKMKGSPQDSLLTKIKRKIFIFLGIYRRTLSYLDKVEKEFTIINEPIWNTVIESVKQNDPSKIIIAKEGFQNQFNKKFSKNKFWFYLKLGSHIPGLVSPKDMASMLTAMIWINTSRIITRIYYVATYMHLINVGAAIKLYKLENEVFPASLVQLVPEYLDKIPYDEFNRSEPIKYLTKDDKAVLYSIGPDRVDDKGEKEFDIDRINENVALGDIVVEVY